MISMDSTAQATQLTSPRLWWVVASLWLVMFTTACQFLIVSPVLPRIGEVLNVEEAYLGTLVTGYAFAVAICAFIAGPISDHVGRRVVLRVGSGSMALSLLLHGLADSYAMLLLLRIFAGMSSGVMAGAATAYIGDMVPYATRGRALGVLLSGMAFGQILGIPLGTLLADSMGFQAPFVIFGGVMIFAWIATMTIVPAAPIGDEEPLRLSAALRTYLDLLRRPEIAAVSAASTAMMFGVSSYIVYQPLWLEQSMGATSSDIATLFLFGGIANAGVGPFAGALSDRIGRKGMVVTTSVGMGLCMALTTHMPSLVSLYGLFFVIMMLVGARVSPLNALMTELVDGSHRGSLMSLSMATGQLGFAVGSAAAGWTFSVSGYASNTWIAAASAFLTGALLALFVPEPPHEA